MLGEALALDVDVRQDLVEPLRHPPGLVAEHEHDGGHEDHAHEEGVEHDRCRERDTDLTDERVVLCREGGEHRDHDESSGHDDAARVAETVDDGVTRFRAVHVGLAHAGREEHLVVHREPEHDADEQRRHEAHDRLRLEDAERAVGDELRRETERREHGEQEAQRGEQRHDDRTEHEHEEQEREADDDGEVLRQGVGELLRHVRRDRRLAGDAELRARGLLGGGLLVAQTLQHLVGGLVGRARLRRHHDDGAVALLRHLHDLCVGHVLVLGRPFDDLGVGTHLGLLAAVDLTAVDDGDHRRVLARAPALGEQVGALSSLRTLLRRRVGRQAEVEVLHRRGQGGEQRDDSECDRPRGLADAAREAHRAVGRVVVELVGGLVLADPTGERLRLEHAHEGGQQRQRRDDGERDGAGRAETHRRQHADTENAERGQRDDDGEAGEDDRRTGRAECAAHGVLTVGLALDVDVAQLRAVARQDEQRVVDTDGEADHRGERGRRLGQVEERGGAGDAHHAEHEAHDGVEDRHARGDERAEGQDEDEQRDADADELGGGARLHHLLHALAAGRDGEPVLLGGLGRVEDALLRLGLDVHDVVDGEVPRHRADAAVLAQRGERLGVLLRDSLGRALLRGLRDDLLLHRGAGFGGVGELRLRHLLDAADLLDQFVDLALVGLFGEGVPGRCLDDELAVDLLVGGGLIREQFLLRLGGLQRGDAGNRELRRHRPRLRGGESAEREEGDEPPHEEERPLAVGRPSEPVEHVCHSGTPL